MRGKVQESRDEIYFLELDGTGGAGGRRPLGVAIDSDSPAAVVLATCATPRPLTARERHGAGRSSAVPTSVCARDGAESHADSCLDSLAIAESAARATLRDEMLALGSQISSLESHASLTTAATGTGSATDSSGVASMGGLGGLGGGVAASGDDEDRFLS